MVDVTGEAENTKPFGDCLSEARESLGMSIDELSKTLNLDFALLEALENSDVDKLPPPIYVQGYIKAYTKALGISSVAIHAEYLKSFKERENIDLKPRSPLPLETNSGTPIVKIFSFLLALLAISAAIFGVYNYYLNKVDSIESIAVESNTIESIAIPMQSEPTEFSQDAVITDNGELIVNQPVNNNVIEELTASENIEEAATPNKEGSSTQTGDAYDLLKVKAVGESWAEIRDDSKQRIYFGMLKVDDQLTLKGKAPFDVFLGNAINVTIKVNDVVVDMSDYVRINNIAHFKVSEQSNHIVFH